MSTTHAVHLTDRVKLDLLRLIEAGGLKPGDKLPPADRLCEKFSVSRTVIREAIASLKAEGRLRSLRGSGVYVVKPPENGAVFLRFMAPPQEIGDVLDFIEFRIGVEIEAAGLAAQNKQDNSLATSADRAFHRAIAEATNNSRFSMFIEDMGERLIPRRALNPSFVDEQARLQFLNMIEIEHEKIFEAISDRKPDDARVAMRRHLEDGRRRYREWSLQYEL
jgi:GntR family transcriptional regulator, transcriptional repressor for pyruvate dehydrogenase complex